MNLFSRTKWAVLDCLTGNLTAIENLPFEIGSSEWAHLRLRGPGVLPTHCIISQVEGSRLRLSLGGPGGELFVDGMPVEAPIEITPYSDRSVRIGRHLLVIRGDKNLERWRKSIDHNAWMLASPGSSAAEGPLSLADLCERSRNKSIASDAVAVVQGLEMGFYLWQVLEAVSGDAIASPVTPAPTEVSSPPPPAIPTANPTTAVESLFASQPDAGELTCPVCWHHFDRGDIMHIAVHESLRGDPLLSHINPDAMLRFHATHFDDQLRALDPRGLACFEIACPHCHRALPPGFVDSRHHIVSIVGDHSAGKSYYLSVLIHLLPLSLLHHFGVRFHDSDPAGNAMLNSMRTTLFGARTPEEAMLAKTQLEGAMYETVPSKIGRDVKMPRPFVYHLESADAGPASEDPSRRCSLIFYDNAGEHFHPGVDSSQRPGAQHVASAAGICFLFDPFNSPEFRRHLLAEKSADPQMEKPLVDQQDIILSEMRVRIAKIRNLGFGKRIDTPVAVLVGKCDAWLPLLEGRTFRDPIRTGRLNLDDLEYNSGIIRDLMLTVAPKIASNAEGISRRVLFFPVSSFGHTPVKTASGNCAPDPRILEPYMVEIPALWILSQIVPSLVPVA